MKSTLRWCGGSVPPVRREMESWLWHLRICLRYLCESLSLHTCMFFCRCVALLSFHLSFLMWKSYIWTCVFSNSTVNWPRCWLLTNVIIELMSPNILSRMTWHFCGWFKIYWGYIKGEMIYNISIVSIVGSIFLLVWAQFSFLCHSVESWWMFDSTFEVLFK